MISLEHIIEGKYAFAEDEEKITERDFNVATTFLRENLDELTDRQKVRILEILRVGLEHSTLEDVLDSNYFIPKLDSVSITDTEYYVQLLDSIDARGLTVKTYMNFLDWCKKNLDSITEYELRVFDEAFSFKLGIKIRKNTTRVATVCSDCYNKILNELM